jgi:hypothetical protein
MMGKYGPYALVARDLLPTPSWVTIQRLDLYKVVIADISVGRCLQQLLRWFRSHDVVDLPELSQSFEKERICPASNLEAVEVAARSQRTE